MNLRFPSKGLYIITDHTLSDQAILKTTFIALKAGAAAVQLRSKHNKPLESVAISIGEQLLSLCQNYQVPLIINDDPEFALQIGADGVHLGKHDANTKYARNLLGQDSIIGVSCYNSLELALQAQAEGADYIAFGRFFSSETKPEATPADIKLLAEARLHISTPIVAIGGITPENGAQLLTSGADVLAVIQGVYGQSNPESATKKYLQLFGQKK